MTAETKGEHVQTRRGRRLWFALAAGPVIWALHLSIVYPITSLACEWGWFPFTILGLTGLQFIQIVVTLIAALVIAVAGLTALNAWRSQRERVPAGQPEAALGPFMAYLAMLMNALFLLATLLPLITILTIEPCAA